MTPPTPLCPRAPPRGSTFSAHGQPVWLGLGVAGPHARGTAAVAWAGPEPGRRRRAQTPPCLPSPVHVQGQGCVEEEEGKPPDVPEQTRTGPYHSPALPHRGQRGPRSAACDLRGLKASGHLSAFLWGDSCPRAEPGQGDVNGQVSSGPLCGKPCCRPLGSRSRRTDRAGLAGVSACTEPLRDTVAAVAAVAAE